VTQQRVELLHQKKNAKAQNIKLQEKRTEQAKRAQRARTEKMKNLESELKKLKSVRASGEEFQDEETNRLSDQRLDDETP
jgi:hypothetical protein